MVHPVSNVACSTSRDRVVVFTQRTEYLLSCFLFLALYKCNPCEAIMPFLLLESERLNTSIDFPLDIFIYQIFQMLTLYLLVVICGLSALFI